MPSIFSHAITAFTLSECSMQKNSAKLWFIGVFCSVIPDIDTLAFKFGIPYETMFGHRGFTHSIFFALTLSVTIVLIFFREHPFFSKKTITLVLFFFICTMLHGILDAMTSGGKGVAFLAPFSNERIFSPFHPITVSPIGVRFFSEQGIAVIQSELLCIWLPSVLLIVVFRIIKRFKINTFKQTC
ncbi:MAG: metal-dependent hydrolase [Legionella sp.]|nr:metal-dependent hydrolase [Legionella sp.]